MLYDFFLVVHVLARVLTDLSGIFCTRFKRSETPRKIAGFIIFALAQRTTGFGLQNGFLFGNRWLCHIFYFQCQLNVCSLCELFHNFLRPSFFLSNKFVQKIVKFCPLYIFLCYFHALFYVIFTVWLFWFLVDFQTIVILFLLQPLNTRHRNESPFRSH